jgi:hypothetical protein
MYRMYYNNRTGCRKVCKVHKTTIINYDIQVQSTVNGNKYFIDKKDGVGFVLAPPLVFKKGTTYRFKIVDGSMVEHPLYISTNTDGTIVADRLTISSNVVITGQGSTALGSVLGVNFPVGSSYTGTVLNYVCGIHPDMYGNTITLN